MLHEEKGLGFWPDVHTIGTGISQLRMQIDILALLNCHTFLLYAGGGGIAKLILRNVICCLQVGSSEGHTPLLSSGQRAAGRTCYLLYTTFSPP